MPVGEQHGAQGAEVEMESAVALHRLLAPALVEPAVQHDLVAVHFQHMLGTGDRLRCAKETKLHFFYPITFSPLVISSGIIKFIPVKESIKREILITLSSKIDDSANLALFVPLS